MPPKFSELPKPDDKTLDEEKLLLDEEASIEELVIGSGSTDDVTVESYGSAEEFVLKNIKNN